MYMLLNLFLVTEPFSKVQLFRGVLFLILQNMLNIILFAKKKIILVKNNFFSKAISLLEIIPNVLVLSRVKLRVCQRQ